MGESVKLIGKGLKSNQVYEPILNAQQLAQLQSTPDKEPFDGDSLHFSLGVEALRLGLAYEYDPFFALAIARVDPLPHQLEAVYNYFLKQLRLREFIQRNLTLEVKGRSKIGEVTLTANEYKTAQRLKQDYWLYVVFNCAANPEVHPINDPVKLGWEPIVKIEHYHVSASKILNADKK